MTRGLYTLKCINDVKWYRLSLNPVCNELFKRSLRKKNRTTTIIIISLLIATQNNAGRTNYEGEWKGNAFFFNTGIVTNAGTCIIHQNEAGLLWITSLLLNIVTISLKSIVPSSNKSMYPSLVKFCWRFFEPLHHSSFHFLFTGIMFAS